MDNQSGFDRIAEAFERARPSVQRGIDMMRWHKQAEARQRWQEIVSMVENMDDSIDKGILQSMLDDFEALVREYQTLSWILSSDTEIHTV